MVTGKTSAMRQIRKLSCLYLFAGSFAWAQTAPATQTTGDSPSVTIRTNARIVVMDVLVKDKAGNSVHGLKPHDFVVLEDGKRQQVKGFEEHRTDVQSSKPRPKVNLPPNTYTNFVSSDEPGAVNIILFDSLNTDRLSLPRAKQQLLTYLSGLPDNARVGLFTLDDQLHLIHGFTDDTHALVEAAKQLSIIPQPTMKKAREVSEELVQARMVKMQPKMYQSLSRFLWNEYESKAQSRTLVTMEALNQLARSMMVFPGRKNLIWISGGLPFDPIDTTPQMQKTAALLAETQIVLYPIDIHGIAYLGADGASLSPDVFGGRGGDYGDRSGQREELSSVRETMLDMAQLTGGRAYINNNDIPGQIQDAVQSSSNYYTIAYHPDRKDWNGAFRKVSVKTVQSGLKVQCRPGYYAVEDPFGSPNIDQTFSLAMQPDVPASTALIIQARVLPPDTPDKAVKVDFLVDVHDLAFLQSADHREQPDLMFVSSAWDEDGKRQGSVVGTYHQILHPTDLQVLMRTGLRLQQEIPLKPGKYQVKLGVVDRLSGKMGTIDVPLAVEPRVASK